MEYVDTVKTSASHDGSMDMMAMMMQMEKFPEFCEPFYYNTTTYQEITDLPAAGGTSSTTTVPLLFNANPDVLSPPPTLNIDNNHVNFVTMTTPPQPPLQVQQPKASSFLYPSSLSTEKKNVNSMAAMREMIFRMAVMQPVHIDPESVKPPKRRNVKISKDPQSVAARHRRERISERIRILQRLVPGGTKMDTASMLDEAIHYVKFLKKQVQTLEQAGANNRHNNIIGGVGVGFTGGMSNNFNVNYYSNSALWNMKGCQPQPACQMVVGSTSISKQLLS